VQTGGSALQARVAGACTALVESGKFPNLAPTQKLKIEEQPTEEEAPEDEPASTEEISEDAAT